MNTQGVWTPDPDSILAGEPTVYYRRTRAGYFVWISLRHDGTCDIWTTRDFEGNDHIDLAHCPSLHSAKLWATKRFQF